MCVQETWQSRTVNDINEDWLSDLFNIIYREWVSNSYVGIWLSKSAGSRTVEGLPLRRGVRPLERLFYSDRVLTSRYDLSVEQIILFKNYSPFLNFL